MSGLAACTARTIGVKSVVLRRIELVVDDGQAGRLGVVARAVGRVLAELGVDADQRHGLRLGLERRRDLEEARREGVQIGSGPSGTIEK